MGQVSLENEAWFDTAEVFATTVGDTVPEFWAFSDHLLSSPYSRTFVHLIHRCLAYDPDFRPKAAESEYFPRHFPPISRCILQFYHRFAETGLR